MRLLQRKRSLISSLTLPLNIQIYAHRTSESSNKPNHMKERERFITMMRSLRTYTELPIIRNSLAQVNCHDQQPVQNIHKINEYGGRIGIKIYIFFSVLKSQFFPRSIAEFFEDVHKARRSSAIIIQKVAFNMFSSFFLFVFTLQFCAIWHRNDDDCCGCRWSCALMLVEDQC